MEKIIIRGGKRLKGKVKVHGAKNAVLPIIAGTLLNARGENEICDAPALKDVNNMIKMLEALGVRVSYENGHIITNAETIGSTEAPYELVRQMRASFLVMGPLLARMGEARIPLPGGCAIGTRPIDQHLKGFKAMGADIEMGQGYIEAKVNGRLQGATIYLDIASVGATENIMMAASLAEGHTVIENAAREPEVVDLANFLNNMGANIRGAGTGEIRIEGVDFLKGTTHTVIPDRIEAGTFLIAAAITRGSLFIEGALGDHIRPLIAKLEEMGVKITEIDEGIQVDAKGELTSTDVKTLPYPGFPTDMQAQMMALMLTVPGTSLISETVFENRFKHVEEFKRMRGNIKIDGRTAVVEGGQPLSGARVKATDLRAGAALILAGLVSEGETEVTELHHLDRGYVDFAEKLARLGADIERLPIEQQSEKSATELVIQPSYA